MKTRGLFLSALLMGAVMASCSNEEVMNNDNEKSLKKSDNYVAVNIVAPSDVASRGEEGDFAAGSSDENKVNNAMFVFYDANGGLVDAQSVELTWGDGTGSVEKISEAVIVLSDPPTWPTQVVALLNTDLTEAKLANMTLAELKALQADYSSTENFVMSNSVYKASDDATDIITATPLLDSQICLSQQDALKNPVSIPVERVLAKVEADASKVEYKGLLDANGENIDTYLDGIKVEFELVITGMALVNTNPESYLLKNIENIEGWENWTDAANWRSYWANSATPENGYETLTWNEISAGEDDSFVGYAQENTSLTATKLLVTAKFKVKDAEDYVSVIKYNGTYYTEAGLKNLLIGQYLSDVTYGSSNSNDWAEYLQFVSAETENEWEVQLALTDNAPTPNDTNAFAEGLENANSKTMSMWTDGACYYYVDIEHFGPAGYNIGIIRNHWYQLDIKSIMGLGTPVFDTSEDITPDKPEEENYFVAAEVKILKWKIVSQEVNLQ